MIKAKETIYHDGQEFNAGDILNAGDCEDSLIEIGAAEAIDGSVETPDEEEEVPQTREEELVAMSNSELKRIAITMGLDGKGNKSQLVAAIIEAETPKTESEDEAVDESDEEAEDEEEVETPDEEAAE